MLSNLLKKVSRSSFHAKAFPMVTACVINPHLRDFSQVLNPYSFSGEVILPPINEGMTQEQWTNFVKKSVPIWVYNAIYDETFPNFYDIRTLSLKIELALTNSKRNPWVSYLLKADSMNRCLDKDNLLSASKNEEVEFSVTRSEFETLMCGVQEIELLVEENTHEVIKWVNARTESKS